MLAANSVNSSYERSGAVSRILLPFRARKRASSFEGTGAFKRPSLKWDGSRLTDRVAPQLSEWYQNGYTKGTLPQGQTETKGDLGQQPDIPGRFLDGGKTCEEAL